MSTAAPLAPAELTTTEQESVARRAVFGSDLSALSEIYQPDVNLSVWNIEIDPALKGESWEGNEGCGLVHRSPRIKDKSRRLLLTLDFA